MITNETPVNIFCTTIENICDIVLRRLSMINYAQKNRIDHRQSTHDVKIYLILLYEIIEYFDLSYYLIVRVKRIGVPLKAVLPLLIFTIERRSCCQNTFSMMLLQNRNAFILTSYGLNEF